VGLVKKILGIADKGVDIAKEAVTDKDLLNRLQYDLLTKRAEFLLTGRGGSVTKWTICILVGEIVNVGIYVFLFRPENLPLFKDFALATTPLIGTLIGVYGGAKTVQKVMKRRDK
jgi:hypothetical protein